VAEPRLRAAERLLPRGRPDGVPRHRLLAHQLLGVADLQQRARAAPAGRVVGAVHRPPASHARGPTDAPLAADRGVEELLGGGLLALRVERGDDGWAEAQRAAADDLPDLGVD